MRFDARGSSEHQNAARVKANELLKFLCALTREVPRNDAAGGVMG